MDLKSRAYHGNTDLKSMIDLRMACGAVDNVDHVPGIRDFVIHPEKVRDRERDTRLWEDDTGNPVGCAVILGGGLRVFVPSQTHYRNIWVQAIEWYIDHSKRTRQRPGEAVTLRICPRDVDKELMELVESCAFERVRYSLRMARSLREPIPEPQLPGGFVIRHVEGGADREKWVTMRLDMFGKENTEENRQGVMRDCHAWVQYEGYIPELDLVVVAPDGSFVAFCGSSIDRRENEGTGRREGWTDAVITRQPYRRRGLGQALMLDVLRRMKDRKIDRALLATGSENMPMQRLARSIGYHTIHRVFVYEKAL